MDKARIIPVIKETQIFMVRLQLEEILMN